MNILLLSTHFNTGGISSYLVTLSRGLVKKGHRVWIATSGGNLVESLNASPQGCHCERNEVERSNLLDSKEIASSQKALLVMTQKIEHITLNIRTKSELDFRIYFALLPLNKIIQKNKIDVIHAQTRITQVMAACLNKLTGKPFVSTCHGFFKTRWSRRIFPCWGERVIAISEAVSEHLQKDFKVDPKQIALIKNGIDLEDFPEVSAEAKEMNRRAFGLEDEPTIGIIARLSSVKGHDVLIEAMKNVVAKFPRAKLLVVGEGSLEQELKRLVENFNLAANVSFYPVVNQSAQMLSLFDVFVMPSRQEGLGLSVMEAQAAGLPVVASKVGGLPSLIEDGRTGLFVPPDNANLLAEAILLLLRNKDKAKEMGVRARDFIQKEFSAQRMVEETVEVYKTV
ncbi:MAG TPA: glycosyltransferase family 4 protein [Candidatus Omnitrophota bacterium]|nr:glycosyltransferase family 4 protein [Candidatus Omnitrophota bacterium]